MNNEVKEALKVLIENNLNNDDINSIFDEFKKSRQVNYEFEHDEDFFWIMNTGKIAQSVYYRGKSEKKLIENFNAFPIHKNKQLEYLAKKQLLERKLFVYADRHGAENIDWNDSDKPKYYIVAGIDSKNEFELGVSNMCTWSWYNHIYFNTREDAENALENREIKELIKEILVMQRELYKED